MPQEIRLIATDLDGTLVGRVNEFPLYSEFRKTIDEVREEMGTVWVACTGRDKRAFKRFFSPMQVMGIMPDYVILKHALIYSVRHAILVPHFIWNWHIRWTLWRNRLNVRRAVDRWHRTITGGFSGVRTVTRSASRLRLRFDSEESAAQAADMLRKEARSFHHLRVFEHLMEVDVRPVPYTKGLAVSELARRLCIPADRILAIGDGHNDLSMLDGTYAGMTGCPANAAPEVIECVHKSGGHIASLRSLGGVMEILKAQLAGTVKSDLPAKWISPSQIANPLPQHRRQHRRHGRQMAVNIVLIVAILYVVLLIFSSFGLVPFAGQFMRPYRALEPVLQRMMDTVYR